ncbi:uncharacterized protein LOC126323091 isoform X2 [Schistocerca gregaria]|nr:uncharacterized protein LOC126323091 isoform X2 [Schistocerca gregaria]
MRTSVFFIVLCAITLSYAFPTPQDDASRGSLAVGVQRAKGGGTALDASGTANVWRSRDGSSSLDVGASWRRVFHGPGAGRPSYYAGLTFKHTW